MRRQTVTHTQDQNLKNLRKQVTLLSAAVSGLVVLAVIIVSVLMTEKQFEYSSNRYLMGSLNSIIGRLQTDSIISQTWMAQTEISDQMILSIADGGTTLQFPGAWKPDTDRAQLLERARKAAAEQGLFLDQRPLSAINVPTTLFTIEGDHGDTYLGGAAIIPTDTSWQSVILLRDLKVDQQQLWAFRWLYIFLLLSGIGVLVYLCWVVAGYTIKPVIQSRQKQVEFIAAASHELRSPLTVIQTSASALGESPETDALLHETIQRECTRMSRLVNDLLSLARSDAGTWSISMARVDIDSLLLEVTDKFLPIVRNKNQVLQLQVPDETIPSVKGDAERLEQLLTILLDNACSYTPAEGHISLIASFSKHRIILKVVDDGPGIAEEHRKQIFERFYRVDPSRNEKNHCGLGLSIAQELATLHGGKLYLANTTKGSTFVLELPRD